MEREPATEGPGVGKMWDITGPNASYTLKIESLTPPILQYISEANREINSGINSKVIGEASLTINYLIREGANVYCKISKEDENLANSLNNFIQNFTANIKSENIYSAKTEMNFYNELPYISSQFNYLNESNNKNIIASLSTIIIYKNNHSILCHLNTVGNQIFFADRIFEMVNSLQFIHSKKNYTRLAYHFMINEYPVGIVYYDYFKNTQQLKINHHILLPTATNLHLAKDISTTLTSNKEYIENATFKSMTNNILVYELNLTSSKSEGTKIFGKYSNNPFEIGLPYQIHSLHNGPLSITNFFKSKRNKQVLLTFSPDLNINSSIDVELSRSGDKIISVFYKNLNLKEIIEFENENITESKLVIGGKVFQLVRISL